MRIRFHVMLLVAFCVSALVATSALAHTEVTRTSPARGGKAKTSIRTVNVTFNKQIRRGTLRVVGPRQRVVSSGKGGRDPRNVKRLLVPLKSSLKPGEYRVRWTIVAADGHDQRGSFRFKLRR